MMESVSQYVRELEGRVEWQRLTCDWCKATYPASGIMEEAAALEAEVFYGWDELDGDDLCPGCQAERAVKLIL